MAGFLNDLALDNVEADPNYIADGNYEAFVYGSEIREKKDGTPSWVINYKISPDAPKHANQLISEWFDLAPTGEHAELKKSFLKRRVLSLGIPEGQIDSLEPGDVLGINVMIRVGHKNGYQNVTNVQLVDESNTEMPF